MLRDPRMQRLLVSSGSFSAVFLLSAFAGAGPQGQKGDPPAPVQFELLRSLHIAVHVKINDAGPYRLIFDLGAPINLVSGRFAVEAGLITKEAAEKPAFFGMRGERAAKKFQVGEVVAENIPVMVMDHPTIKAISEVLGPIDGIVGYPFFARYKFAIDYPAETMTFEPGSYKPQNVMNQMMGRMFGGRDAKKERIASAGVWGVEVADTEDGSPGVIVTRIVRGGAAERAGLEEADRILTCNGRWTDSPNELLAAAALERPGETLAVEFQRGDETMTVQVTPMLGL